MPTDNAGLHASRAAKFDEFYTPAAAIAKEVPAYARHFKNKFVYCNCDDPARSEFWRYFKTNFGALGLRRLTATHCGAGAARTDYDGVSETRTPLEFAGDFRSPECQDLLAAADVVVTNPPFSLFREFIGLLLDHGKDFLVIGDINACFFKEIRPHFAGGALRLGHSIRSGGMEFRLPAGHQATTANVKTAADGTQTINVDGVRWFTNLDHGRPPPFLELTESYDPANYPPYDNYPAIEVAETKLIPKDYAGEMGVPISFLNKYNPAQFEIVGFSRDLRTADGRQDFYLAGTAPFARLVVRHRLSENNG